ncbi:MAG: winged helix-turn-helix transcriptional regulator [Rubellimicrobium sp.]|nr:winged helix-turn-helix transcriptional regulator [Rubellimicrobium sp.]
MDGMTAQIASGLGRIAAFGRAGLWQEGQRFGLSPTQVEILARVAVRPERTATLAAHLGISPASLSESVSALVARGLVVRGTDPADRRARPIAATTAGREVAARIPATPPALQAAIAALPADRRGALLSALIGIVAGLQDAGAIPVQRMCLTCRHFRPQAHPGAERPHHCAFTDAPLGDADLRIDCGEHGEAPAEDRARIRALVEAAG